MYDVAGNRPRLAKANGNTRPGDGERYCGRGYVQLTWRNNYRLAAERLKCPLEDEPNLALTPDIAARIMRHGMEEGWFTGRKLSDYLPSAGKADARQFTNARKVINGLDRADLVAGYALTFQSALRVGGW
jgi:putative chitinase